jgi:hypothetical protein
MAAPVSRLNVPTARRSTATVVKIAGLETPGPLILRIVLTQHPKGVVSSPAHMVQYTQTCRVHRRRTAAGSGGSSCKTNCTTNSSQYFTVNTDLLGAQAVVGGGSSWENMRVNHASMVNLQLRLTQNVEAECQAFFTFMDSALRKVHTPSHSTQ